MSVQVNRALEYVPVSFPIDDCNVTAISVHFTVSAGIRTRQEDRDVTCAIVHFSFLGKLLYCIASAVRKIGFYPDKHPDIKIANSVDPSTNPDNLKKPD